MLYFDINDEKILLDWVNKVYSDNKENIKINSLLNFRKNIIYLYTLCNNLKIIDLPKIEQDSIFLSEVFAVENIVELILNKYGVLNYNISPYKSNLLIYKNDNIIKENEGDEKQNEVIKNIEENIKDCEEISTSSSQSISPQVTIIHTINQSVLSPDNNYPADNSQMSDYKSPVFYMPSNKGKVTKALVMDFVVNLRSDEDDDFLNTIYFLLRKIKEFNTKLYKNIPVLNNSDDYAQLSIVQSIKALKTVLKKENKLQFISQKKENKQNDLDQRITLSLFTRVLENQKQLTDTCRRMNKLYSETIENKVFKKVFSNKNKIADRIDGNGQNRIIHELIELIMVQYIILFIFLGLYIFLK